MKTKIYLASQSPRRKKILERLGLKFKVWPAYIQEPIFRHISPEKQAIFLALKKAKTVAFKVNSGVVIACDTIVVLKKRIIGKPKNIKQAKKFLLLLNNSCHYVITAVAVIKMPGFITIADFEKTAVWTHKLEAKTLDRFAGIHLDKAGAYAIQERKDPFVKKISGSFSNVVGLPVAKLCNILSYLT